MPGALVAGHELDQRAVALDEKVRRHLQVGDVGEIRMGLRVQRVAKQRLYLPRAELPRRQADVVDHQQRYLAGRSCIEVR
ncbi:hypothetical protein D3C81_2012600 [compost metagenome]